MNEIDIRKTHPNFYWLVMTLATIAVLLGLNFIINQPTFLIHNAPNTLWGGIFLALGSGEIIFMNFYRRLRLVRACIAFGFTYTMVLAWGTTQPFFDGVGSLQLPILYAGLSVVQIPLMLEPVVNPLTRRE